MRVMRLDLRVKHGAAALFVASALAAGVLMRWGWFPYGPVGDPAAGVHILSGSFQSGTSSDYSRNSGPSIAPQRAAHAAGAPGASQ